MAKTIQEHLERIKSQRAPWDEPDLNVRNARLAEWFSNVAKLPFEVPIQEIVTHNRPHVDEILELWLAAKYPSAPVGDIQRIIRLDELEDADRPFGERIILRTDKGLYRGTDWLTHWRNGVRLLGTGGGVLDEHPNKEGARIEKEAAATLMARLLCVVDKPELRRLLKAARAYDAEATRGGLIEELTFIKTEHRGVDWDTVKTGSPEDKEHQLLVIRKGLIVLNRIVERELRMIKEVKDKLGTWAVDKHEDVCIASIESNCPFMADYIRGTVPGISVMIIRKTSGHTAIMCSTVKKDEESTFSNRKNRIPPEVTTIIAQEIRKAEALLRGRKLPQNPSELTAENCETVPEWHFTAGNVFNGTESVPNLPATGLGLGKIEDIVTEVLAARASRIREWRQEKRKSRQP